MPTPLALAFTAAALATNLVSTSNYALNGQTERIEVRHWQEVVTVRTQGVSRPRAAAHWRTVVLETNRVPLGGWTLVRRVDAKERPLEFPPPPPGLESGADHAHSNPQPR